VYLGAADAATLKTNRGGALEFSPTRDAKLSIESHYLTNSAADSDYLGAFNSAYDFKVHDGLPPAGVRSAKKCRMSLLHHTPIEATGAGPLRPSYPNPPQYTVARSGNK
jgi:hypothetical protein